MGVCDLGEADLSTGSEPTSPLGGGDFVSAVAPSCRSGSGGGGANSLLLFSWSISLSELSDEFLEKQTGVSSMANFCFSSVAI